MRLRRIASLLTAVLLVLAVNPASAAPPGEAVMAWHVTIAPAWLDPSTAPPQITPFGISTRSTMRSSARCPARRWPRAWRNPGRRAPTASRTSSRCVAAEVPQR